MGKRAFRGHVPGKGTTTRDEFPCGKKRPQPAVPNERVMEARAALGLTDKSTVLPIAYAYSAGWLTMDHLIAADHYAGARRRCALDAPGFSVSKDESVPTGAAAFLRREWEDLTDEEVRKLSWGVDFTSAEVAKIWDSAFRPTDTSPVSAASAMRRWKAFAAAMNPAERDAVDRAAFQQLWPAWVVERRAGRMDSPAETERDALISGLGKVAKTVARLKAVEKAERALKAAAANDRQVNDNEA